MIRLQFDWLRVGHCRHLECVAQRGGRVALTEFPSLCGLIRHPHAGYILFDTGYAPRFFGATAAWPERLYRLAVPVTLPRAETLVEQLQARGIEPGAIRYVFISHYHGDHVAGLRDFPNARFIADRGDSTQLLNLRRRRWQATLQGQLPALLPDDFQQRVAYVDEFAARALPVWLAPFTQGRDLLGDGSLLAIALPGHSRGQTGLFLHDGSGRPVLLAADACWSLPACRDGRLPSPLARIATADPTAYAQTFHQLGLLAQREPDVAILPSHCAESWRTFRHG